MKWLLDVAGQEAGTGVDNWFDDDGSWWCVDVGPDGTAYTYCSRRSGDVITVYELPDDEAKP